MENSEKTESRHCEKHGYFESKVRHLEFVNRTFETRCPHCADEDRADQERAEREQEARLRFELIGLPDRFKGKTLHEYKAGSIAQQKAKQQAMDYVTNFGQYREAGRCLIFTGMYGTGKTHLAAAIAGGISRSGFTVRYFTLKAMLSKIKSTWSRTAKVSEESVINSLIECDLLILDEIGLQYDTNAEKVLIFEVLDGRYNRRRPTMVISNYPVDAPKNEPSIKSVLGDRALDRMREGGGGVIVFNWASQRPTI